MVKSKKMSKTSIAVIVLAILLTLSLVLGLTGAWFTDINNAGSGTVTFGEVDLDVDSAVTYAGGSATLVTDGVMPGDTITGTVAVNNNKEAVYVRISASIAGTDTESNAFTADQISITGVTLDGNTLTKYGNYYYAAIAAASDASTPETESFVVTIQIVGDKVGNTWQAQTVTLSINVDAIQQANITAGTDQTSWEAVFAKLGTNGVVGA